MLDPSTEIIERAVPFHTETIALCYVIWTVCANLRYSRIKFMFTLNLLNTVHDQDTFPSREDRHPSFDTSRSKTYKDVYWKTSTITIWCTQSLKHTRNEREIGSVWKQTIPGLILMDGYDILLKAFRMWMVPKTQLLSHHVRCLVHIILCRVQWWV